MTSGDWNTTSPGRILIVDDAPENIQILHQTLKEEHEVFFATSGAQALQLANQLEPELILLDVIMPGMNGYQVCQELKQSSLTKEIPVIFITALNEEHDETAAFAVGGVDYIAKPIRPAVVKARVKTHLMLKRQREFLSRLSLVDGLTGVCNRRHFDERMRLEWRRAHRNNSTLAIIMADVDHFKRFNDTYGHQAGDDCLKTVAESLQAALQRPADFLARYGGEEFVCILPETTPQGAQVIAERMCSLIAEKNLPHSTSPTASHVTVSVGVAYCLPDSCPGSPEELLMLADECLYRAKREGRNRVITIQTPA